MRLDYFRKLTISHPLLLRAYEDVRCAIRDCEPGSVILVQGPAGVGKTTLLCRFEKDFREQSLPDLTNDVGRLPVVRINAIAPDRSKFDWKDYFRRLLVALGEPESLINRKIIQNQSEISIVPTSIVVLRHAIDQALSYRGTLAVLVDDIQHMGSGYKLHDQISILKSIASLTQTTHVLTSTYDQMNGQKSHQAVKIEFNRYSIENRENREAFISCLQTFERHLPLAKTPDLVKEWDYFYERCIGCIGVLKDWLTRVLVKALDNGGRTLTIEEIQRQALSVAQCTQMLADTESKDLGLGMKKRKEKPRTPKPKTDRNGVRSQNQAVYQSWEISLPEMSPRSRLYPLAPIGGGTPDVESLTSFIEDCAN
jgi:energy-coupling factor transporter ATP-binding protein EcfA2